MKNFSNAPSYLFSKGSQECTVDLLTKSAVVPTFTVQFKSEFGEHKSLPTSQAIGNNIDCGRKRLELLLKIENIY
jgi:hypothetical protein